MEKVKKERVTLLNCMLIGSGFSNNEAKLSFHAGH